MITKTKLAVTVKKYEHCMAWVSAIISRLFGTKKPSGTPDTTTKSTRNMYYSYSPKKKACNEVYKLQEQKGITTITTNQTVDRAPFTLHPISLKTQIYFYG